MYIFGNTKPARSIWTYFVSKMFHDCIIFNIFVLQIMLYVGIVLYLLALPEILGHEVRLRHCAISRKVAGSIPNDVVEIFHYTILPAALWP